MKTWRRVTDQTLQESTDPPRAPADDGYSWLHVTRDEAEGWPSDVGEFFAPVAEHVVDSLNPSHPPYRDGTDDYELIIVRELLGDSGDWDFRTGQMTLVISDGLVVSIADGDGVAVGRFLSRIEKGKIRVPRRPEALLHRLLDSVVDGYLALRVSMTDQLATWQDTLLDPHHPFDDWSVVMRRRSRVRRLAALTEEHVDVVTAWREETSADMEDSLRVRFNDLIEHLKRVEALADHVQGEIDTLVQLHFAATAHRTNEIVRVLTVLSAIFLPLTLVAGVFGMNFHHMPELRLAWAYPAVLIGMVVLAGTMLVVFRRRKWF